MIWSSDLNLVSMSSVDCRGGHALWEWPPTHKGFYKSHRINFLYWCHSVSEWLHAWTNVLDVWALLPWRGHKVKAFHHKSILSQHSFQVCVLTRRGRELSLLWCRGNNHCQGQLVNLTQHGWCSRLSSSHKSDIEEMKINLLDFCWVKIRNSITICLPCLLHKCIKCSSDTLTFGLPFP